MSTPMRIKFWVYVANLGDGSAAARFFKSQKEAEAVAEADLERFCEDVYETEILVDPKTRKLVRNAD